MSIPANLRSITATSTSSSIVSAQRFVQRSVAYRVKALAMILVFALAVSNTATTTEPSFRMRTTPTLSAKEAIDVAENFLKEFEVSTEKKFLARVVYHEDGPRTEPKPRNETSGPYWQVTYEPIYHADGGEIFIFVYMNRVVQHMLGS